MGVSAETFENLLDLYPKTRSVLRSTGLVKREAILHYISTNLQLNEKARSTGIPVSLTHENSEAGTPTSEEVNQIRGLITSDEND